MKNKYWLILIVIVFIGGILIGYWLFKPAPYKEQITSQTILQSLQSRGFLVTESVLADQKVQIENKTGTLWKDIIWGQEITASAIMKVSMGVDLTKLSAEDIQLKGNRAIISLPEIELQSVELSSNIHLDNNQGILKKLLDNDDGYNLALDQLKTQAQQAALTDEIKSKAKVNAQQEIARLIKLLSPEIIIEYK